MPVDYSKWDNIELSDDEDFECHPNVDKNSMIRWKQAELYRVRRERKDKVDILKREMGLNQAVVDSLKSLTTQTYSNIEEIEEKLQKLKEEYTQKNIKYNQDVIEIRFRERDSRWRPPEPIPICEARVPLEKYIENAVEALKSKEGTLVEKLQFSIETVQKSVAQRKKECEAEIELEEKEANKKLTSENMYKEVFSTKATSANTSGKTKVIETIHTPSSSSQNEPTSLKQTATAAEPTDKVKPIEQFARISDLDEAYKFLGKYPSLVNQASSDEVLAEAFNFEMSGKTKLCKNGVKQALLLQYSSLLGKDGVRLFFQRMSTPGHSARDLFEKDVTETYKKIVDRVKVLKKEEEEKERAERLAAEEKLKQSLLPDGTYALPVSENPTPEELEQSKVFAELPVALQRAMLLQDVDEINAALSAMDKETTDVLVKKAVDVGLIELTEDDGEEE